MQEIRPDLPGRFARSFTKRWSSFQTTAIKRRDGLAMAGFGPRADGNGFKTPADPLKEQEEELMKAFDRLKSTTVKSDYAAAFHARPNQGIEPGS